MFVACLLLFSINIWFSILEARMAAFNLESSEIYQSNSLEEAIEASIWKETRGRITDYTSVSPTFLAMLGITFPFIISLYKWVGWKITES